MNITIQPGDYVAVSDITCEAIHAAVVKCFEAAGAEKTTDIGLWREKGGTGLYIFNSNRIGWGGISSCKRQLTLQQLFTATNSIRWPDWATDIRTNSCASICYFTDGEAKFQYIGESSFDHDSQSYADEIVLAVRPCSTVSDSELRPAPELGWYDWSADSARELPPVGAECAINYNDKDWFDCIFRGQTRQGMYIVEWLGGGVDSFGSLSKFRPANYEKFKSDLERNRAIQSLIGFDAAGYIITREAANAIYAAGWRPTVCPTQL